MQGILLINKDRGFTSHNVVSLARKSLKIKKIGHAGTLDPMATGILVLLVGKATKISDYVMGQDKVYEGRVVFGQETDTLDADGEVLKSCEKIPSLDEIKEALPAFQGEITQLPPMYSAIKMDGKKLYEYAREGKAVERKERRVSIYSFDCLAYNGKGMDFRVHCSSGTYIRSLLADFARSMGSLGTLTRLERTKLGNFSLDQCHSIEDLKEGRIGKEDLIPMDQALNLPSLEVSDSYFQKLIYGQALPVKKEEEGPVKLYCKGLFMGIGFWENENELRLKKRLIETE